MKGLGIALIILGIAGFLIGSIVYKKKDTVADLGPIEITTEKTERIPITPIASGVAVVAGIALVLAGTRRRA